MSDDEDNTRWVTEKKTLVDPNTGEMYTPNIRKLHRKHKEDYTSMFRGAVADLLVRNDFNGLEVKLFFYIAMEMDYKNWFKLSNKKLAKTFNVNASTICRSLKFLREEGLLIKEDGNYRFNSNYGWRGTIQSLDERRKRDHLKLVDPYET